MDDAGEHDAKPNWQERFISVCLGEAIWRNEWPGDGCWLNAGAGVIGTNDGRHRIE